MGTLSRHLFVRMGGWEVADSFGSEWTQSWIGLAKRAGEPLAWRYPSGASGRAVAYSGQAVRGLVSTGMPSGGRPPRPGAACQGPAGACAG